MADETFGFSEQGVERIVNAVRQVEGMPVRMPRHRRRAVSVGGGRDLKTGVLDADCTSGGTATFSVYDDTGDTGDNIEVNNDFSATVTAGATCKVAWVSEAAGWYIVSADCVDDGGGDVVARMWMGG